MNSPSGHLLSYLWIDPFLRNPLCALCGTGIHPGVRLVVFLTKKNVVKLGDFGIARVLDSTLEQVCAGAVHVLE